jgi:hypothetical protein
MLGPNQCIVQIRYYSPYSGLPHRLQINLINRPYTETGYEFSKQEEVTSKRVNIYDKLYHMNLSPAKTSIKCYQQTAPASIYKLMLPGQLL